MFGQIESDDRGTWRAWTAGTVLSVALCVFGWLAVGSDRGMAGFSPWILLLSPASIGVALQWCVFSVAAALRAAYGGFRFPLIGLAAGPVLFATGWLAADLDLPFKARFRLSEAELTAHAEEVSASPDVRFTDSRRTGLFRVRHASFRVGCVYLVTTDSYFFRRAGFARCEVGAGPPDGAEADLGGGWWMFYQWD